MHLPVFAAAAGGLFADHDLDVELLSGSGATTERIASGDAEFGLTATLYFLRAQAERQQSLPVRFVLPLHQRDPIAALVRADSGLVSVPHLAGRPTARWGLAWMTDAYTAALAQWGISPPETRPVEGDPSAALRDHVVEVVPTWAETIPVRSYAGITVRTIPLDLRGYASGLVAADRVDDDIVARMCSAVTAGFEAQRRDPGPGLDAFNEFYPDIPRQDVDDNWRYFLPFASPGPSLPRTIDSARWKQTVTDIQGAHGLATLDAKDLYRIPALSSGGL